ncbi:MAG: hypothetical protein CVV48_04895 [Spirochaetae bacterium HGW-Spirochaetae-4]|jgi:GntR family transcriptional regulator|nr:MAG: hypothetical protein CVV52_03575 [Spirochaetae bacterium HGW-Spirochaetae-8]PKL22061.1 MAG: hypothetical protein CVV48_04895 [Spirochaetae bacterium HGW-Spirochaetae-4]
MTIIKLDESEGALPLYSQVAYHLEHDIEKGKIPIGSRLPSQQELSESFGVSRITILKALELLRDNGIITSKQGIGSTVIKAGNTRTYQSEGFSARYSKLGKKVLTKVISITQEECDAEVSENLLLIPGSKVIHIQRVRYLDDLPISVEHVFMNYKAKTYSILKTLRDNQSLYQLFKEELGLRFTYAEEKLFAELPSEENQRLLDIHVGHPVMKMLRVTYEHLDDPPTEFCRNYYNNETYGYYGIVSINLKS